MDNAERVIALDERAMRRVAALTLDAGKGFFRREDCSATNRFDMT
jgi:hypothetical protein